jgi:hypothetical protein
VALFGKVPMRATITMHPTIYVPSGTPFEILVRIANALSRNQQADSSKPLDEAQDASLVHAQHAA